jgi:hypothetical protein
LKLGDTPKTPAGSILHLFFSNLTSYKFRTYRPRFYFFTPNHAVELGKWLEVKIIKTDNQLTFTTYEASLKLNPNNPIKIIFDKRLLK